MTAFSFFLSNEAATVALGTGLGSLLGPGDVVLLSGGLGAGKTTLARAAIHAATGVADAQSPSFPLVLTYEAPDFMLWHFDLFRLEGAGDIDELGWEEAKGVGACLVEWPERLGNAAPANALRLAIEIEGAGRRVQCDAPEAWARRLADAGIVQGNPPRS